MLLLLHSERRRRSPTPPIDEEERDKRTVFVMQLAARLRTRELADFFSEAGKVRDAKIIADRISRRSKGWVCNLDYFYHNTITDLQIAIQCTELVM